MLLKIIGVVLSILFGFSKHDSFIFENRKQYISAQESIEEVEKKNIVSYKEVFKTYYSLATKDSPSVEKTFDEFVDEYYSEGNDKNLFEYTYNFGRSNGIELNELRKISQPLRTVSPSTDANYILSSTDYNKTPHSEFKRDLYSKYFDYSSLVKGDIIYECKDGIGQGHCATIVNVNKPCEDMGRYIQTIEAVGGGVQFGFLDDLRMVDYRVTVVRVVGATTTKVESVVTFLKAQLGKPYFYVLCRMNTSINSANWYCSELCYAAYHSVGIEINIQVMSDGTTSCSELLCSPRDILYSTNTYEVQIEQYGYAQLSVINKVSNKWTIRIQNNSVYNVEYFYNEKMCFPADATNQNNLHDIVSVVVPGNDYVDVQIKENWFATAIVVYNVSRYYMQYDARYDYFKFVSYATELSNTLHSLHQTNLYIRN